MSENQIIQYNGAEDFADVRQQDIITPYLRLQQFTSPGVQEGKFTAGDYIISGEDKVAIKRGEAGWILPIMWWLQWIEWHPDRNAPKDKRMLGKSFDPQSSLAARAGRFDKVIGADGKEKIAVTEYYNFIVLLPELTGNFDEMFVFGFSKSSHKVGKQWINRLRKIRLGEAIAPIWSNLWSLGSTLEKNANNEKYMVPSIGAVRPVDKAWFPHLNDISTAAKQRKSEFADRAANAEAGGEHEKEATATVHTQSEI